MSEIKIYRCGTDWYAAKNLRDAVRAYVSMSGEMLRDALENTSLLDDNELDTLDFMYDPYGESERCCTFRARLAEMIATGERFPTVFACEDF